MVRASDPTNRASHYKKLRAGNGRQKFMATCSINTHKACNFTAFRSFLFWLLETV